MTEDAQLKLRVPLELKDAIEAQAKANYRTINGEVVYRLEKSINDKDLELTFIEIGFQPTQNERYFGRNGVLNRVIDYFNANPEFKPVTFERLDSSTYICWFYKPISRDAS